MQRKFALETAGREVSDAWVSRFHDRHKDALLTRWTKPMNRERYRPDSYEKIRLYFEFLHEKLDEHQIRAGDTYNMDEKGFAIGVLNKSKRTFSREAFEAKRVTAATQDGNREWVSVLACNCADGSTIPLGIIFASGSGDVQLTWVQDIEAGIYMAHFSTSLTGWTNDDLGLAWLEQVFDRYTRQKARRRWRLLIVDGHGSHITTAWIDYCLSHGILLMVFPPHSTHTLQPLDVVCFSSLAANYSGELVNRLHTTDG